MRSWKLSFLATIIWLFLTIDYSLLRMRKQLQAVIRLIFNHFNEVGVVVVETLLLLLFDSMLTELEINSFLLW